MANSLVKLTLESNQYERNLRQAQKTWNEFTKGIGMSMSKFPAVGAAIGAVTGALKVAKDAFMSSEENLDEWGRTVQASESLYKGFLNSLNSGNINGFLNNISTITEAARPAAEPLPGYRQVTPMVYCGVYPADGADYPALKDALEKLRMNDASLSFEPETSVALGYGFRCGFLGLLHMDIITTRLEREWDLNLVTTAPSVIYHVFKTDGTEVDIDNPSNLPAIGEIEHMEEPYVTATIYTPQDFVGAMMDICVDKRGIFIDMQYEGSRVKLIYEMPLNEIIYEFFDQVKSRSRGYASFDYELKGYLPSELVKMDILLNGDICDAFSIIVHKDKAYARGRSIAEKLKEVIPRQMFEIPIQAAIGGKVIARETVKAMRKDVLAKCYGGDITRKKKLLEKQKEGKKKMRNLGTVQVPTEAFMAVLKLDSD